MCECEEGKCSCKNECSEQCCNCGAEEYDKSDMFFYLAKEAKMDLLKEKIKKRLDSVDGKKLDKAAELIVDMLLDYYKTEDDISNKKQEFNEKLEKIFSED